VAAETAASAPPAVAAATLPAAVPFTEAEGRQALRASHQEVLAAPPPAPRRRTRRRGGAGGVGSLPLARDILGTTPGGLPYYGVQADATGVLHYVVLGCDVATCEEALVMSMEHAPDGEEERGAPATV